MRRQDVDPELGLVPIFPDIEQGCPNEWIASGSGGILKLMMRIAQLRPSCVVVQDQRWRDKILCALLCRLLKIPVAMRSDKNRLSVGTRSGFRLWVERFLVLRLFNILCPVSELTASYYGWPASRANWPFTYCTNKTKFGPPNDPEPLRSLIRSRFGIPEDAFVFLSVVKFIERENPRDVINAFKSVVASYSNAWLLMVGAGPQFDEIRQYVGQFSIPNTVFAGYVPYANLEDYFFAADIFVHLAKNEPWGISPQDALIAGLGLITSDKVGSGVCHLQTGDLRRFVVPVGDLNLAVDRMIELISNAHSKDLFQSAKDSALNGFTTESLALQWALRDPGLNLS
jgi:glycosyltransferase involved in cell wall biosynthesis